MVTVAAACLRIGWGILTGESWDRAVLGGKSGTMKGPARGKKGEYEQKKDVIKNGMSDKKGLCSPNEKGNCAFAIPLKNKKSKIINNRKIYNFMFLTSNFIF